MSRYKESNFFKDFFRSYIPNKRDNLKQIIIKVLFIVSFVGLVVSAVYIGDYFITADREASVIEDSRQVWHSNDIETDTKTNIKDTDPYQELLAQNSDFKGWITIDGTQVDNPVYQTDDNSFYLNHNQEKKSSAYGALFIDYQNTVTETQVDRNIVIYGHEMKNGSMFGSLKKLKNLSFYKEHSTIEFTLLGEKATYKIYSIFILNAAREDDGGYIYNISRQNFIDQSDFDAWVDEAYDRSIIDTGVDVEPADYILTLVTCSEDFENARLVVMARKLRSGEDNTPLNNAAHTNPNPTYPQKWYDERGIKREEE